MEEWEKREDRNDGVAKIKSFGCILNYACIIDTTSQSSVKAELYN